MLITRFNENIFIKIFHQNFPSKLLHLANIFSNHYEKIIKNMFTLKIIKITGGMDRSEKCRHSGSNSRRGSRCNANVNNGESSSSSSETLPDPEFNAKH